MGKQDDAQSDQKNEKKLELKQKTIVKKLSFNNSKFSFYQNEQKELKDWKPIKLNQANQANNRKQETTNTKNGKEIFSRFLSNLPKPKSVSTDLYKEKMQKLNDNKQKKIYKQIYLKMTQDQLQWDAEDEYIKKTIEQKKKLSEKGEIQKQINQQINQKESQTQQQKVQTNPKNSEQEVEYQIIEKIVWLNEKQDQKNKIDIAEIVSKKWENQAKSKQHSFIDQDSNSSDNKYSKNQQIKLKSKSFHTK